MQQSTSTKCGYHSWYVLGAVKVATTILKNYRKGKEKAQKVKQPHARRLIAKLGNQAYKIIGDQLNPSLENISTLRLHKRI